MYSVQACKTFAEVRANLNYTYSTMPTANDPQIGIPKPVEDSPKLAWRTRRDAKRKERASLIPEEHRLSAEQLASVPATNVPDFLDQSGWLTSRELEITNSSAATVLDKLRSKEWSCFEVTSAIIHRAAIAHQITNCLTEIMFTQALKRCVFLCCPRGSREEAIVDPFCLPLIFCHSCLVPANSTQTLQVLYRLSLVCLLQSKIFLTFPASTRRSDSLLGSETNQRTKAPL